MGARKQCVDLNVLCQGGNQVMVASYCATRTLHLLSAISLSVHVRGGECVKGQGLLTNILCVKDPSGVCFAFQLTLSHLRCAPKTEAHDI